jgi:hypothetical protein
MLRSVNDLQGEQIHARDGDIGNVDSFLFDDESWTIRYLVVKTGNWLMGRKVLISPISIAAKQEENGLTLSLTRQQIKDSPDIDTDKPVSRQHEIDYSSYYGYPFYWFGPDLWGPSPRPVGATSQYAGSAAAPGTARVKQEPDSHLRSSREVIGYYIEATDGDIGHVEDFLVEDQNWAIRYVVVDTVNWWPGKKVIVSPDWVESVSWAELRVHLKLSRQSIKSAPEYDPSAGVDRDYEERLYNYYGSAKYWD